MAPLGLQPTAEASGLYKYQIKTHGLQRQDACSWSCTACDAVATSVTKGLSDWYADKPEHYPGINTIATLTVTNCNSANLQGYACWARRGEAR